MTKPNPQPSALGRLATDLGPLLVFFLVNFLAPVPKLLKIFYATGAFMAAMIVAMLISLIRTRTISPLLWFSGAMVVLLGGLTIWLHNDIFIKMKPTFYYLVVAALLGFSLATRRNLLKAALGTAYPGLSERGWRLLTRNWAIFFAAMAIANEAVWRSTSTNFWIGSKIWGFIPATLLFAVANIPMMLRHGLDLRDAKDEPVPPPPEQER